MLKIQKGKINNRNNSNIHIFLKYSPLLDKHIKFIQIAMQYSTY